VRDKSNTSIVLGRIQRDRDSAQVKSERFERRIGCTTIRDSFVVRNYPGSADEQVRSSRNCSATFTTGHRMRTDVAGDVGSESAQLTERSEFYTRDIRDESVRVCDEFGGNSLGDDIRRNADNDESRLIALRGGTTRSIVNSQPNGRRGTVGKDDVDSEGTKTKSDTRAEKPGTDDANRTRCSRRTHPGSSGAHESFSLVLGNA
jgi:hypothetical protein